ncbi:MAG: VWA domain-containing protein [Candidatus Goldbacteria bacterium]|nr:VWA domain-containing protein [Candidatus Goldiibacteriota bacterium]
MRFANRNLLLPILILGLIFLISLIYNYVKLRKFRFSNFFILQKTSSGYNTIVIYVLDFLKVAGLVFLIIALLRPQKIQKETQEDIKGIDIIVALDISGSMQAEDLKPNRLEAAKEVIRKFVSGLSGDRVGLVVFAGTSFFQCPLTTDYEIIKSFIDQIDFQTIRIDGTAMGDAIITSINRLENSGPSRVIILTTDGVNNRGFSPIEAAQAAIHKGIKIYTIGIGKKGGAPMMQLGWDGVKRPVIDRYTGQQLKWEEPDEKTLTQIANMTGGRYFRATDEKALKEIYEMIGKLEKQNIKIKTYNRYIDRFQTFLWIGLIILLIDLFLEVFKFFRVFV